ncbi:MAG: hypothetical protein MJY83_05175 [Bacteroidales bacterium]|nr:hypothetical protein [Bacteroidales bacterium]
MRTLRTIALIAASLAVMSCQYVSGFLHDDKLVAEVGSHKLHISELEAVISNELSPEDSAVVAEQYISTWVNDMLFLDLASSNLSKEEMDVTKEVADYKQSLLKYRYEQKYVNERLDTVVRKEEIEKYYNEHKDIFVLDLPIVKARFMDIMMDSPNYELIRKKFTSTKYEDIVLVDSLARASAIKYLDSSETWIDAVTLAREFGTDYSEMLSRMRESVIEMKEGDRGDVKVASVVAIQKAGTLAPLDYCSDRIKEIIISYRKHRLLSDLERDLLNDAVVNQTVKIYKDEE